MAPEEILAAVFGPLQWTTATGLSREAHTSYREQPLTIKRTHSVKWGYYSTSLELRLTRPIEIHLLPADTNTRQEYAPLVDTGDPAFHAKYRVRGSPPQLIARALDPALRRRLLETPIYPGTLNKVLDVNISRGVEGAEPKRNAAGLLRGWAGEGDASLARARVELFFDLVEGIQSQVDQTVQHVEATEGPAAAQAWMSEQDAAIGRARSAKLRAVALAAIPAILLLAALLVWALLR